MLPVLTYAGIRDAALGDDSQHHVRQFQDVQCTIYEPFVTSCKPVSV